MDRSRLWTLAIALTVLFSASHESVAQEAPRINCEAAHQLHLALAPPGTGPLKLRTVYCQRIRATLFRQGVPVVSPNGQWIAYLENDAILRIAQLGNSDSWIEHQAEMGVFARFGRSLRSLPAIAWASDSQSVWAGHHDAEQPSRFATSPLQPLAVADDGRVLTLPPLQHEAGPLDGLLWADGDGLAVAQFGTRGGYYRPDHLDPNPSFAIIDVRRGIVRQSLAFAAIGALKDRVKGASPQALIRNATATRLADGKVRTLIDVGPWIVWTEGQAPLALANPYAAHVDGHIVMSPDGSRVLVARLLRVQETICERSRSCPAQAPAEPFEGVLAAMHDITDGHLLWTIRATVSRNYELPVPAISPDGRFALIALPPEGTGPLLIALVALDDGKIVHTIPSPGAPAAMGFARGGELVWTHAHGLTALYDVQPNRPQ